jgi:sigma-B regulation protein RsbU (phosphoserine phosphatase)
LSEPPNGQAFDDLEDLFENAPCGYLSLRPDGIVVHANATIAGWLGVPKEGLVGRRFRDLLTVPARIFYETHFAPLLRMQGAFDEVALDLVAGSGEKLQVLANASERRDANGEVLFIRVALFRARDRRRYERDILNREATARRNLDRERATAELREQFIAVLGHDLRNPLAAIIGAARLLRREPQSDKALQVLGMMETSVDRMAGLIDNVLDFARGKLGGGFKVDRSVGALEPVLQQLVAEFQASQPTSTFEVECTVAEPVSFDRVRLSQLISNLLGNALSHGDPSQPIRLRAGVEDGFLIMSVANAGEPISAAAMERLFQPFFRGEVRASQQGLGLGLHIASEIAKAHGGALTVASSPDQTQFTLRMPATEPANGQA